MVSQPSLPPAQGRPIIGIPTDHAETGSLSLASSYCQAVSQAGGLPVLIPALDEASLVGPWLQLLDGLLLAGGADIDPCHFGEDPLPRLGRITPERDSIELALARAALQAGLPVLGICRGLQVICVAAGGTLLQDIRSQVPGALKHRQQAPAWYGSHEVILEPGTRLAGWLREPAVRVNSFHHQAVDLVPPGFIAAATAPDGIIEAIEGQPGSVLKEGAFALGVQWHPEAMLAAQPAFGQIFAGFVAAAAENIG